MTDRKPLSGRNGRFKVGVVANEFFDLGYSRMGGFGWATRQLARCFQGDASLGVDLVFVDAEAGRPAGAPSTLHGVKVIARSEGEEFEAQLNELRLDLLLSIDYRKNYRRVFRALPKVPVLVWARDPRGPEDAARIRAVRLPDRPDAQPAGLESPDTTSLSGLVSRRWWSRRVVFGTPSLSLKERAAKGYGLPGLDLALLPNIIDMDPGHVIKSERPTVVFLARLDAYKRPWVFAELAKHFPSVEFLFLGQAYHGEHEVVWHPRDLPSNVRLMGHVDGEEKTRILSSAWALINTSIHEGLAVSFLEALTCETPLLSCIDTEEVASRFGIYVGSFAGTGMDAIPAFAKGLRELIDGPDRRIRLGKEGRHWVATTHNRERFLDAFRNLCVSARAL